MLQPAGMPSGSVSLAHHPPGRRSGRWLGSRGFSGAFARTSQRGHAGGVLSCHTSATDSALRP
eukprot:2662384-Pleurochrysis_carterae.AAC.1